MAMGDPLEQFEIKTLIPITFGDVDISFTNSSLYMALAALVTVILVMFPTRGKHLVPDRLQCVSEIYYEFLVNLVRDIASPEARRYFPFVFTIFSFVLFGNILGLTPYGFTFTSHIIVTFSLAMIVFLTIVGIGFARHGVHFLHIFMPAGAPLYCAPLLIPIEMFSFCVRPITLSVRLFANMLAGHILLKVIISFVAMMGVFGIVPFVFTTMLIGFELFVACLQAYIFALLTCVYLKDAIHLH